MTRPLVRMRGESSRMGAMKERARNIRRTKQKDSSPFTSFVIAILFVVCLLVALWAIIVATRVVLG